MMMKTDAATSNKMRAVRQAGTAPEIAMRAALESLGVEFEANAENMPGRPDLWVAERRVAIFVHGCFWHRHEGCSKATTPKRNREFWLEKFRKNVERDARKVRELETLGHSTFTVWQCETTDAVALKRLLLNRLSATVTQRVV